MLLEPHELELLFKLHRTLMFFVNQRLNVVTDKVDSAEEFADLSPQVRLKVRDALNEHLDLIQSFVDENPAQLSNEELDIFRSWRHQVAGKFYVFRELKNYTVFLVIEVPTIAYGVLALSQPFEDLIGPYLPVMTEAVLLPFRGKIVYDGKMFKMYQFDPNWTLPSRLWDNPIVWMLQVNGFTMDVRHAPREVQEIAF
ncbi:MAG: hypothetical protein FJ267_14750, partial [Planctomycetes bacterium]|nr:hypothetical protein [Planctomycetota bacterium]